jgi:uncharacterized hydrophobic protein (TIGR00271 family)
MLHVRVVTPTEVTERLTAALGSDPGVRNLVVFPAAARPDGDFVQFDVTDGSGNSVFQKMKDFGIDTDRQIDVDSVDAAIGGAGRPTYHGEHPPVWPVVESRIRENAEYAPSFYALLAFAGLIGACGILTNSQILIVGAMVVGPEYSAILAVALGIDRHDGHAIREGVLVLVAGFLFAIAVTLLFALCIRWSGRAPQPFLHGVRPVSDLINSPNLYSIVVAVVAGIVGVVALTLSKTGALIGVFISITTIPAAADIGVSLAFSSWSEARGSALQLLLNLGLLIIVGALALQGQRFIWRDWTARQGRRGAASRR